MGNIKTLTRKGHTNVGDTSFGNMDMLDYAYRNSGVSNRLYKVRDDGNEAHGFKDSATDDQEDWYEGNGNMTRDDNKGITAIEYNQPNMPTSMTLTGSNAGTLDFIYDVEGAKT